MRGRRRVNAINGLCKEARMSHLRFVRRLAVVAAAVLPTLLMGTAASAATPDRTPPTAPQWGYAEGFYCLTLIVGVVPSTDNVTPQSQIGYVVYDDGVAIGSLVDRGNGPWATLVLRHQGTNAVAVQAIDQAGNRSAFSRSVPVTGYFTPGCTPYHF
jgi:hypothetical protein